MRPTFVILAALACLGPLAVGGVACTFSAHPPSGVQACASSPPLCLDGYTCVAGRCYLADQLPGGTGGGNGGGGYGVDGGGGGGGSNATGMDGGGGAGGTCTAPPVDCGKGAGKRCGRVADACGIETECGICSASGETCQSGHVCAVSCGDTGAPCCTGSKCNASDAVCSNDACVACGSAQQPCCANDACGTASTCVASATSATTSTSKVCLPACVTSAGACTQGTDVDCDLQCGPAKLGNRACTCTSGTWKCATGCAFPTGDYSCYKLPTTVPACGDASALPTIGAACTLAACTVCGSASGKGYIDATGTSRSGYCVCTSGHWICAVTKEWPCPGSSGC